MLTFLGGQIKTIKTKREEIQAEKQYTVLPIVAQVCGNRLVNNPINTPLHHKTCNDASLIFANYCQHCQIHRFWMVK